MRRLHRLAIVRSFAETLQNQKIKDYEVAFSYELASRSLEPEVFLPYTMVVFDSKELIHKGADTIIQALIKKVRRYIRQRRSCQCSFYRPPIVAARAKSMNRILVTNNEKEFNRVVGLRIENWV